MEKADAIICIKKGRYLPAANFIVKGILQEKIHPLGQRRRDQITRAVARMIREKHTRLRADHIGLKPKELAEQVYNETIIELMRPANDDGTLSD